MPLTKGFTVQPVHENCTGGGNGPGIGGFVSLQAARAASKTSVMVDLIIIVSPGQPSDRQRERSTEHRARNNRLASSPRCRRCQREPARGVQGRSSPLTKKSTRGIF